MQTKQLTMRDFLIHTIPKGMLLPQPVLALFEAAFSLAQGKGYGTASLDEEIAACLKLLGARAKTVLDIGANKGCYSEKLLKKLPNARFFLFEPSKENIAVLNSKFANQPRVQILDTALSDQSGTATLFANESGSGLASLTKRRMDHFSIEFKHEEPVRMQRFDEFWPQHNIPMIDYCKIDVEGHELSVLKGFGAWLDHVKLIQFEFGGCNIDTRTYFQDFWYYFTERGFALYRITPFGPKRIQKYTEQDEFFRTTNYIALNEKQA